MTRSRLSETLPVQTLLWTVAALVIAVSQYVDRAGWDLRVYEKAMYMVNEGKDPYASGIAKQEALVATRYMYGPAQTPFQYLYPPITLPVLRVIGNARVRNGAMIYWIIYSSAIAIQIYLGSRLADTGELSLLRFLAPAVAFFPGLLLHNNVLGGNISFISYGIFLSTAALGWTRNNWIPFYVAVLVLSCCKPPWLTLLLLPVFLQKKQWFPASIVGALGSVTFAVQRWVWPSYFHNFLWEVNFEFIFHGFGVSPAGLFAMVLFRHGYSFLVPSGIFYFVYASVVLAILVLLARRFQSGRFSLQRWIPVLLIGIFLLNPRLKDYDVAPLTIPMGLTIWRLCESLMSRWVSVLVWSGVLALGNIIALTGAAGPDCWNLLECLLLALTFVCGSWQLFRWQEPGNNYRGSEGYLSGS